MTLRPASLTLPATLLAMLFALPAAAQEDPRLRAREAVDRLGDAATVLNLQEMLKMAEQAGYRPNVRAQVNALEQSLDQSNIPIELQRDKLDLLIDRYPIFLREIANDRSSRVQARLNYAKWLFIAGEEADRNIVYRGGTPADFEALARYSEKLVTALEELGTLIKTILDDTTIDPRDRVAAAELDQAAENEITVRWFLSGARLRLAIALANDPASADRVRLLASQVTGFLTTPLFENTQSLVDTPHSQSRVQYEALRRAGEAYILLNQPAQAFTMLDRIIAADEKEVADPEAILRARFVATRLARDTAKTASEFELASRRADQLLEWIKTSVYAQAPAFQVNVLNLRASILTMRADLAVLEGQADRARTLRREAFEGLVAFAEANPGLRGLVNDEIGQTLESEKDPTTLTAFQINAKVGFLLGQADRIHRQGEALKARGDQAAADAAFAREQALLEEADLFLTHLIDDEEDPQHKAVLTQAQFDLIVTRDSLSRLLPDDVGVRQKVAQAAMAFVEANPDDTRVRPALDAVVRAAAGRDDPILRNALDKAGEVLLARFPEDPAIQQFFGLPDFFRRCAAALVLPMATVQQILDKQATIKALIDEMDKLSQADQAKPDTLFMRVIMRKSLWDLLVELAKLKQEGLEEQIQQEAIAVRDAAMRTRDRLQEVAAMPATSERARLQARGDSAALELLTADVLLSDQVNKPAEALQVLEGFETRYSELDAEIGRAIAFASQAQRSMGNLEAAKQLALEFRDRNPDRAGVVIRAILVEMLEQIEEAEQDRDLDRARQLAEQTIELADTMVDWVRTQQAIAPEIAQEFRVQQARVSMFAEQLAKAERELTALRDERARLAEAAAPRLEAIRQELRILNLRLNTDPSAAEEITKLEAERTELQARAQQDRRVLIGLADVQFRQGKFKEAAESYTVVSQQLRITPGDVESERAFFRVRYQRAASEWEVVKTLPPGEEKDARQNQLAIDLRNLLLDHRASNMAGYRRRMEEIQAEVGPVKEILSPEALALREQKRRELEEAQRAREIEQKARGQRLIYGIAGGVAGLLLLVFGFIALNKRRRKTLRARLERVGAKTGVRAGTQAIDQPPEKAPKAPADQPPPVPTDAPASADADDKPAR